MPQEMPQESHISLHHYTQYMMVFHVLGKRIPLIDI